MAIRTYSAWKADGEPSAEAGPIHDLASELRWTHGPRVGELGVIGNLAHLTAATPQDHCPFSQTGWPIYSLYPKIHALDWAGPGYARQFRFWVSEARAGRAAWVKYINIDRHQYRFMPSYTVKPSSDDPTHGHLSVRSDWSGRHAAYGWVTVRRGDRGPAVARLQAIARSHDVGDPLLVVDGVFGPKTEHWVRSFQDGRGITTDGIAGPRTRLATFIL